MTLVFHLTLRARERSLLQIEQRTGFFHEQERHRGRVRDTHMRRHRALEQERERETHLDKNRRDLKQDKARNGVHKKDWKRGADPRRHRTSVVVRVGGGHVLLSAHHEGEPEHLRGSHLFKGGSIRPRGLHGMPGGHGQSYKLGQDPHLVGLCSHKGVHPQPNREEEVHEGGKERQDVDSRHPSGCTNGHASLESSAHCKAHNL